MTKRSSNWSTRDGLWTKSKRNEADAVGCLLLMGSLIIVPAILIGWGAFLIFLRGLVPVSRSITWSDLPIMGHALWQWALGRSEGGTVPPLAGWFAIGLFLLLWQWTAVLLNWRVRLSSPRIWMLSSCYFLAVIVAFALMTWPEIDPAHPDQKHTESVGAWLMTTLLFSVVPGAFLAVTLPLWLLAPRHRTPPTSVPTDTTPLG